MDLRKMTIWELLALAKVPIYQDKHFIYASLKHGPAYVNLRVLKELENIEILNEIAYRLLRAVFAQATFDFNKKIVVVGPDTLGAILAHAAVAEYKYRDGIELRSSSFAVADTDENGNKKYKWAADGGINFLKDGDGCVQVIWMDDLMTSGSTWNGTRHLIGTFCPNAVKAVATIVNRSDQTTQSLGTEFVFLEEVTTDAYDHPCPLCKANEPIVSNFGRGAEFQATHPKYGGGYVEI
jgi:adenine/guanine phosphoribosyltransferase-like PRPP-binding protein